MIDLHYTSHPYFGVRRMAAVLRRDGHRVNEKRVLGLMRVMGLETIYPNRSGVGDGHHVRATRGWVYVVAVMDWFSRYVLSWEMSPTLEGSFCVAALKRALGLGVPEIFNSDQGSRSRRFAGSKTTSI